MIPSDPKEIEKLKKLAARNIANGDWGDEVNVPGLPGDTAVPVSPGERTAKQIVSKRGSKRAPKRN
jgi:hypothetical protein